MEHKTWIIAGAVGLGALLSLDLLFRAGVFAGAPSSAPSSPASETAHGFGETQAEREQRLARSAVDDPSLDARIDKDAIVVSHGDSSGVTAADVPVIRAGARMILKTRASCPRIEGSDAVINEPGRYYVTCSKEGPGGFSHNYFFSKSDVEAAGLLDSASLSIQQKGR